MRVILSIESKDFSRNQLDSNNCTIIDEILIPMFSPGLERKDCGVHLLVIWELQSFLSFHDVPLSQVLTTIIRILQWFLLSKTGKRRFLAEL